MCPTPAAPVWLCAQSRARCAGALADFLIGLRDLPGFTPGDQPHQPNSRMTVTCLTCGLEVPEGLDLCPRDGTPVLAGQSAADPLIGAKLGDYVITCRIGGGGMGIVYEAIQPVINKRVAVKVIRPDVGRDEKGVQRFLEEARTSTSIRHRGIVDVFNFGQLPDGRPYMVMEYLNGASLEELIAERGSMTVSECLWILDEVLSALIAAHRAGVIHRDLKPSN